MIYLREKDPYSWKRLGTAGLFLLTISLLSIVFHPGEDEACAGVNFSDQYSFYRH